jgi:hypothetical protein
MFGWLLPFARSGEKQLVASGALRLVWDSCVLQRQAGHVQDSIG